MTATVIPMPRPAVKVSEPASTPSPSFRFSKTSLRAATDQAGDNVTLRDSDLRGFICRKQKRDWIFGIERRIDKKLHRITLGQWTGSQNVDDVRKRAEALIGQISAGTYVDPKATTEADTKAAQAATLADMGLRSALHLHLQANPRLRATTADLYASCLLRFAGITGSARNPAGKADPIGTVPDSIKLRDITRTDVQAAYNRVLQDMSAASASGMLSVLRAVWNSWAGAHPDGQEPAGRNPVEFMTKKRGTVIKTAPKERALPAELRRPWYAAATASARKRGPLGTPERALMVLFLTGMRRDEILSLQWTDFSADGQTFTIPADRMKAHQPLTRPVTPRLAAIFAEQRSFHVSQWVFPAVRGGGHAVDPKRALAGICRTIGFEISNHDLRRGYIGTAMLAGVSDLAVKLLVGHTIGDITQNYALATIKAELPAIAVRIEDALLNEVTA